MTNVIRFPQRSAPDEPGMDWEDWRELQDELQTLNERYAELEKQTSEQAEQAAELEKKTNTGLWFFLGALLGLSF